MNMSREIVEVEKGDGVLIITLSRPEKMNALEARMLREVADLLQEAREDDEVKVVVITGAGRAFCSGADLSASMETSGIDATQPGINRNIRLEPFVRFGWLIEQIENLGKPTIAAVNGAAVGAGLAIAAACDIRIASDRASLASMYVKRGLVPDCGLSYYLPRLVGVSNALEMMWSGDPVDAKEAERIGLVNKVVPANEFLPEVKAYAKRLAAGPSIAIELTKRLVGDGAKAPNVAVQMANESSAVKLCLQTQDFWEALRSFSEKREPHFKGE